MQLRLDQKILNGFSNLFSKGQNTNLKNKMCRRLKTEEATHISSQTLWNVIEFILHYVIKLVNLDTHFNKLLWCVRSY
jgi:hypothetical protein